MQAQLLDIDTDSRVRARYGGDTVIVFRDVGGANWGWYTREDPRMHLQTVDQATARRHKVWLERDGERVFEPEGRIPSRVVEALRECVAHNSNVVEAWWTNFMIEKAWLRATLDGRLVHLACYPNTSGELHRQVDLDAELPGLADQPLDRDDVRLDSEHASLMVLARRGDAAPRVFLPDLLWTGQRTT